MGKSGRRRDRVQQRPREQGGPRPHGLSGAPRTRPRQRRIEAQWIRGGQEVDVVVDAAHIALTFDEAVRLRDRLDVRIRESGRLTHDQARGKLASTGVIEEEPDASSGREPEPDHGLQERHASG